MERWLSPICADFIMTNLKNSCIGKKLVGKTQPFFKKYADGLMACIRKNELQEILRKLSLYVG